MEIFSSEEKAREIRPNIAEKLIGNVEGEIHRLELELKTLKQLPQNSSPFKDVNDTIRMRQNELKEAQKLLEYLRERYPKIRFTFDQLEKKYEKIFVEIMKDPVSPNNVGAQNSNGKSVSSGSASH